MLTQELIDRIAADYKAGKTFIDIHKDLMNSDHSIKDINQSYRLIRIVGADNSSNLLEKMKSDKQFLKKNSGLAPYFNVILIMIGISILFRLVTLYLAISKPGLPGLSSLILVALLGSIALMVVAAIAIYSGSMWGLWLFFLMLILSINSLTDPLSQLLTTGTFDPGVLVTVFVLVVGFFSLYKINKKFTFIVP